MTKIIESRNEEEFNPEEFEKNDIQKWVNYLSDQEVKENIYAFNTNHQSNMLTWVIQQSNEILSNCCPEYTEIQSNEKVQLHNQPKKLRTHNFQLHIISMKQYHSVKPFGASPFLLRKEESNECRKNTNCSTRMCCDDLQDSY